MSGYLRFWFAAFLFLAGLSPSPASSNPFAVFLGQAVPAEATAQRPAEQECLSQPGKSTADGRHWVYRFNNHRKCWFQAAEETVTKEPIHHHAGKHVAAPKATQAVSRKRNAVVDARAELPQSVPVKPPQQPPPALELKV